jgi:electron transfer flavoprotein alpha subunit
MSVLIYTESAAGKIKKASLEAIYYGNKIAAQLGTQVVVLSVGNASNDELATLGNVGANKVLTFNNALLTTLDSKAQSKIIGAAVEQEQSSVIVFSADLVSKAIAPRLSARYAAGMITGATTYPTIAGNTFVVRKPVFSGKAYVDYELNTDKKIIVISPNSFPIEKTDNVATVSELNFTLAPSDITITLKEVKKDNTDHIPLPEAELVVSGGRGLKGPENWGIVEDLAKALGAATACSRPVSDIGWRPHHEHVGQTGIAVKPNLYIAAGISGAIQHLAGVNQSKTIVVINTDKEAPFFKAADYGIVGDVFEILPKLTAAVAKFKASAN